MPQPVAGSAEGDQVFQLVGSPFLSRHNMMHFQEPCPPATGRLAPMFVPCQHFPAYSRWNGRRIASSGFANGCIAAHSFGFGPAQFPLARIRLDG